MKKISVIIPVWNTKEFLNECVESVRLQTHKTIEIILVDDSSADGSRDLIASLAKEDGRIHPVFLQENKGIGYARNRGLDHATGDYVYFLDSDDYIAPNALELLMEEMEKRECEVVFGSVKSVHVSGVTLDADSELPKNAESIGTTVFFEKERLIHGLISGRLIKDHQLRFGEKSSFFSEYDFFIPLMSLIRNVIYCEGAVYFKRKRNDPVSNPSFSQKHKKTFFQYFQYFYKYYKERSTDPRVLDFLDRQFVKKFEASNKFMTREEFEYASRNAKMNRFLPNNRAFRLLKKNQFEKFNRHLLLKRKKRTFFEAFRGRQKLYLFLYKKYFSKWPIRKKTIVFESFLGKNYSDSPKNIYEYMVENQMDYRYIWVFNRPGRKIPGNAKQVKRFSLAYYYHLARAKYWVSNSRLPKTLPKREGNVYVQTWHGTPLKKLVFDMKDILSANPKYKLDFYRQSRRWDFLLSPNRYSSDIFKRCFKFERDLLEYGYPRNDIFYSDQKEEKASRIRKKMGIPADKKVILYAPTWRDHQFHKQGKYKFDLELDLKQLEERIGNDYVVLLRMHYLVSDALDLTKYQSFAYDVSKYDDIADLYLVSDILITDYSSVMFDFANTRRPMLFFTYDLDTYRDTLRGFYFDFEQKAPGPLLKTTGELIECIENMDQTKRDFQEKYDAFYETFCSLEDGKATQRVVERVFGKREEVQR